MFSLPNMGGQDDLNKLSTPLGQNLVKIGHRKDVSRLRNFTDVYSPGARADNPWVTKF